MQPVLSAILPAWDTYESIRGTVAHLRRQTIAGQLEVVFVVPDVARFHVAEHELSSFHSTRTVTIGQLSCRARAFAEGVRAASAPLTVLCEDHCFPVPGWAEALVNRHASGNYAAVGAFFNNANPENTISDADLVIAYGPFLNGIPGGETEYLPGHNSCYRREVLLAEGDNLGHVLESEYILHTRLTSQGIKLYIDPAARVYHMNFATWGSASAASYLAAKVFAANRAVEWPLSKRAVFLVACPIVPFMRLRRMVSSTRKAGWPVPRILKTVPALFTLLTLSAIGEWVGNLLGRHSSTPSLVYYEFHRQRFSPAFSGRDIAEDVNFS